MTIRYCSPEWLEESAKQYRATDHFEKVLNKVTTRIYYRVTAEPTWGIEKDILFGAEVDAGKLLALSYFSEKEAINRAEFILSGSPQIWKEVLQKDKKFITEFMLGKIQLEAGSKPGLLKITPYANHFVDALTQFPLQFQDEMTSEELECFRTDLSVFREKNGL